MEMSKKQSSIAPGHTTSSPKLCPGNSPPWKELQRSLWSFQPPAPSGQSLGRSSRFSFRTRPQDCAAPLQPQWAPNSPGSSMSTTASPHRRLGYLLLKRPWLINHGSFQQSKVSMKFLQFNTISPGAAIFGGQTWRTNVGLLHLPTSLDKRCGSPQGMSWSRPIAGNWVLIYRAFCDWPNG